MNTSPKTTRAGLLSAAGAILAALGEAWQRAGSGPAWLPLVGLSLVAVGQALGGWAARDNGVSDEAAGAKDDPYADVPTTKGAP